MSGIDIFIAVLSAVMFFGGLYLNFRSRKLVNEYQEAHKVEPVALKSSVKKTAKLSKK
jgi:uncharacterized phage-associated protein